MSVPAHSDKMHRRRTAATVERFKVAEVVGADDEAGVAVVANGVMGSSSLLVA
ncbi:hypothetical protein V7S43_012177 [Phytophthora oleae]|uniref:Uncharacterized protein n=1 Tax=Phytophthora oleae TaxID=2107226 RepID=A0ABD3F8Y5_9STRA